MLKLVFNYLDAHPAFYWLTAIAATFPLVWWVREGLRSERPGSALPPRSSQWIATALTLFACLLAWRWPYLFSAVEYNPDESQFIAGAITLARDPVFWRAVDGTTSGPLNFYALLPLHCLGLPLDYFSARLTALLLVWAALGFCYACLRERYGRAAARLGILPAVAFFSFVHEWDFIHYSSEHVSLALLAAATWLLSRHQATPDARRLSLLAGGAIAGLLPWAKIQTVPLGLLLVGWGCWQCIGKSARGSLVEKLRAAGLLLAVAATPSVLAIAAVLAAGQWDKFLHGYLLQNIYYISADRSLAESLGRLAGASTETWLLPVLAATELLVVVCYVVVELRRRERLDSFLLFGLLFTLVAATCVAVPRRGFLHYALLVVVPLVLWGGTALAGFRPDRGTRGYRRALGIAFLLGALAFPCALRIGQGSPDMIGLLSDHWRHPRTATGNILRRFAAPGDELTVWGWLPRLHVESALPQATRLGYSYLEIMPSPLRDYHRAEFVRELRQKAPAFFVDAVGPNSFYFLDRATQGHETLPGLRDFIQEHYVLIADLGYARTYCRRDLFDTRHPPLGDLPALIASGRPMDDINSLPVQNLALTNLPERNVADHPVRMMLPPAETTWLLDGTEREFIFEYGYDPVAWKAGQGNGTEFQVILDAPGQAPQLLFHRLLNPAHLTADRAPQTAQIALPALPIGARLRIQTTPGEFNDNSWDWAYISRVRYRRGTFLTETGFQPTDTTTAQHAANAGGADGNDLRLR